MVKVGAAFWPLQIARELDDAILHLRNNELEIGTLDFQIVRRDRYVLAYDEFLERQSIALAVRMKSVSSGKLCSSAST